MITTEDRGEWMKSHHGGPWHKALYHESLRDVTGKVFSRYHTTACGGASLYSPWNRPTVIKALPSNPGRICKRCAARVKT